MRMFRGTARPGMEARYAAYLREVAVPKILNRPGVREVRIYEPLAPGGDFVVKSVWEDVSSLTSFTGPDWDRPRILPAEEEMVASASVSHHRPGYVLHGTQLSTPRVSVDAGAGIATVDGETYDLPPLESRLLAELVERAGRFVGAPELARAVWGGGNGIAPNDVRRAIYRLRHLIGDDARPDPLIRGRRGYGYTITDDLTA